MKRDYRKEFRDCILNAISSAGSATITVTMNDKKFRCKPNVEGGVNVYVGKQRKPTKALTLDEFVEWADENCV